MLRSTKTLQGYAITGADGEVGKVDDVFFDDHDWTVRYLVADTGGWLTGRLVLVSPNAVQGIDPSAESLRVSLTKEQIENAPSVYEDQPVSRQYEADFADYYGYPYYWGAPLAGAPGAFGAHSAAYAAQETAPIETDATPEERGDPHLRSAKEVNGYTIRALDGDIGHLDDLLLDDATWRIEQLVVATRDWLPGKKVVLAPATVREVDWPRRDVAVGLSRDQIEHGPEYDPSRLAGASADTALFG